ncbi:MAG: hypothetical protein AAGA03_09660 [Planctomycetota bacterium]
MRRWLTRIGWGFGVMSILVGLISLWAVRQTRHVPEFYANATEADPVELERSRDEMVAAVDRLREQAGRIGSWDASFSDQRINAWLTKELPRKFPRLLAKGARDPRVVIEDGKILAAVRYESSQLDTVISCEVAVELTEEPNMLAVRLHHLKAGALPLPLSQFLKGISTEAARGELDIRWDQTEEGPVALVTIPSEHPLYVSKPVVIESVRLEPGWLKLSGHTGELAKQGYRPRGQVHEFVSYNPLAYLADARESGSSSNKRRSRKRHAVAPAGTLR